MTLFLQLSAVFDTSWFLYLPFVFFVLMSHVLLCRYLHSVLVRNQQINEKNKGLIIETLRQLAELMIWGDQHEPQFFECASSFVFLPYISFLCFLVVNSLLFSCSLGFSFFFFRLLTALFLTSFSRSSFSSSYFLEHNMLGFFLRILGQKTNKLVKVQLLQTLSILIENIRNEGSLCKLMRRRPVSLFVCVLFCFVCLSASIPLFISIDNCVFVSNRFLLSSSCYFFSLSPTHTHLTLSLQIIFSPTITSMKSSRTSSTSATMRYWHTISHC